jgi:hypothetical protein
MTASSQLFATSCVSNFSAQRLGRIGHAAIGLRGTQHGKQKRRH